MVLIIALVAMVVPVMAVEEAKTLDLSGAKSSSATITITNTSGGLNFASFATSATAHHISPTEVGTGDKFATLNLTTNEKAWHIYAYDAAGSGEGKMVSGTSIMKTAMGVTLAQAEPSGITLTPVTALTSTTTAGFLDSDGSQTLFETETPMNLDISQLVTSDDPAGTYQITLTLRYVTA